MKENFEKKIKIADQIRQILDRLFPAPKVPLYHLDDYTLLIAVLLSARCTDERVNQVTPILFSKAKTPHEMVELGVDEIQKIIKPCGLRNTKANNIYKLSQILIETYQGEVPQTLEALEELPGVGHKTASVVVIQAFHQPAFPVDTHIHRCAKRWGLSSGKNVVVTERDLKAVFPKKLGQSYICKSSTLEESTAQREGIKKRVAQFVSGFMKPNVFLQPTRIEIQKEQLKLNFVTIKKFLGKTLYCLPIKANAYGHGLIEVAQIAKSASIDYLAVSNAYEGVSLREAGIECPILVFGAFHKSQIPLFLDYHLEFTISSLFKAKLVQAMLKRSIQKAKVHLEIETGMQRTGSRVQTAKSIYAFVQAHSCFECVGIYSHFATAADQEKSFAYQQLQAFNSFIHSIDSSSKPPILHLCNSAALSFLPQAHHQMVRPGLLSFGLEKEHSNPAFEKIRSAFSLKSVVSYFKVVAKGSGISYGHTFVTPKQTRIATIPIGYGDGYPRCLSNRAQVLIRGKRYPIVGAICMDQLMVDIGEGEAYVDDEVVLIGKQGSEEITIDEIAEAAHTIPYEILCGFTQRVERRYL